MTVGTKGFFLFLLIVVLMYHLLRSRTAKYTFLLLASWTFYCICSPKYLWVLLLLTGIDYLVAFRIEKSHSDRVRRTWLILSIISNLGLLFAFKYTVFLYDSWLLLHELLGNPLPPRAWDILLPLGISFHTFQGISYTVDVYRRQIPAVRSFLDYALFVAFFPQLAAGPIVRAVEFLPQMINPPRPTAQQVSDGLFLFCRGLVKKLLIADYLDLLVVSPVFSDPSLFTPSAQRWAVIAWAVQIYCDFSGYTDLAIGSAKWFGFELPANFRLPYLACDMADFWRRWHLSFSTWLRDYLYFPLGGSRGAEWRTHLNLMILFTLCGLWHGATGAWLIYGIYNGLILCLHRIFDRSLRGLAWADAIRANTGYRILAWICTISQLLIALILVRMPDWTTGMTLVQSLLGLNPTTGLHNVPTLVPALILLGLAGHIHGLLAERVALQLPAREFIQAIGTSAAIIAVTVLSPGISKTFLYIQF